MSELKSCPFCGKPPEIVMLGQEDYISCHTSGCAIEQQYVATSEAWNRRADDELDARRWRHGSANDFPHLARPCTTAPTAKLWTIVINNKAFGFETAEQAIDAAIRAIE